jgi:dolichol-phosphate mannosyltransferase
MIYFIIPAFNEAANLPGLLSSIGEWSRTRHEPCHLIVVDDGSRDATPEVLQDFRELPLTVVRHDINRGVHEVFRSGFSAWSKLPARNEDLVITLEADNTSSLTILDAMLIRARQGDDLVLASCYAPGGDVVGTNLFRVLLSFSANLILRSTPGMPTVYTFSSFYRVYRAPFLEYALGCYGQRLIEERGFVCVVEMLLKFGTLKARISEVPLRLDGSKRQGNSKMKVLRTIRGYLTLFAHAVTGSVAKPVEPVSEKEMMLQKSASGR